MTNSKILICLTGNWKSILYFLIDYDDSFGATASEWNLDNKAELKFVELKNIKPERYLSVGNTKHKKYKKVKTQRTFKEKRIRSKRICQACKFVHVKNNHYLSSCLS